MFAHWWRPVASMSSKQPGTTGIRSIRKKTPMANGTFSPCYWLNSHWSSIAGQDKLLGFRKRNSAQNVQALGGPIGWQCLYYALKGLMQPVIPSVRSKTLRLFRVLLAFKLLSENTNLLLRLHQSAAILANEYSRFNDIWVTRTIPVSNLWVLSSEKLFPSALWPLQPTSLSWVFDHF